MTEQQTLESKEGSGSLSVDERKELLEFRANRAEGKSIPEVSVNEPTASSSDIIQNHRVDPVSENVISSNETFVAPINAISEQEALTVITDGKLPNGDPFDITDAENIDKLSEMMKNSGKI